MRIINKKLNINYKFNLLKQNIFLLNNIDAVTDIQQGIENLCAGKTSTTTAEVIIENNDISVDKTGFKVIKVPNYFDFNKDISGGGKTILKELLTAVLKKDLYASESFATLLNLVESLDMCEFQVLKSFEAALANNLQLQVTFQIQDQIINYLAEQTFLEITDLDGDEVIVDQNKARDIYFELIDLLWRVEDKNIFFLFLNPFFASTVSVAQSYLQKIQKLEYFVIISDKNLIINLENLKLLKMQWENKLIDCSEILDDYKVYMNFSEASTDEEFLVDLSNKLINMAEFYNNLKINELSRDPLIEYLINI